MKENDLTSHGVPAPLKRKGGGSPEELPPPTASRIMRKSFTIPMLDLYEKKDTNMELFLISSLMVKRTVFPIVRSEKEHWRLKTRLFLTRRVSEEESKKASLEIFFAWSTWSFDFNKVMIWWVLKIHYDECHFLICGNVKLRPITATMWTVPNSSVIHEVRPRIYELR